MKFMMKLIMMKFIMKKMSLSKMGALSIKSIQKEKSRAKKMIEKMTDKLFPLLCGSIAAIGAIGIASDSTYAIEAIGGDVSIEALNAITVESWDRDYSTGGWGWEVYTNRDPKSDDGSYQNRSSGVMAEREVKLIRGSSRAIRENIDYPQARILGIKFAFSFPGFNAVSIQPPAVDHFTVEKTRSYLNELAITEKIPRPSCYKDPALSSRITTEIPISVECVTGVQLPGKVEKLSVWVLGRGNQYDLEAWLEDWRGDTHVLKMGSVDFVGWKPLTADVPARIPQEPNAFPQTKSLLLKKLKLRSRPNTSLETVYIFFDELRILTRTATTHFDGMAIDFDKTDCERKNNLIKQIKRNSRYPQIWKEVSDCSKAPGPAAPLHQQGPGQTEQPPPENQ